MKNLVPLLVILALFSHCKKLDDSDLVCTSNCTTLSGKFTSLNDEPVSNIKVSLTYKISGGFFGGGSIRKLVETKSDKNGNFKKQFYIKDSELGDKKGFFSLEIDDSEIDINKYVRQDNFTNTRTILSGFSGSIKKRDTVINNSYYIPKKAFIKVNLTGFKPQVEGDLFNVETLYPFGSVVGLNKLLDSPFGTGFSGAFSATGTDTSLKVFVAEGENNIIRIRRRKNGITSYEDARINIPANNSIELTYDY